MQEAAVENRISCAERETIDVTLREELVYDFFLYHAYSKLWVALFPVRKVCKGANAAIRRAGKRVLVSCGLRDRDTVGKAGRK